MDDHTRQSPPLLPRVHTPAGPSGLWNWARAVGDVVRAGSVILFWIVVGTLVLAVCGVAVGLIGWALLQIYQAIGKV